MIPGACRHHKRHASTSLHPRHAFPGRWAYCSPVGGTAQGHPSSIQPAGQSVSGWCTGTSPTRCSRRAQRHRPGSSHRSNRLCPSGEDHGYPRWHPLSMPGGSVHRVSYALRCGIILGIAFDSPGLSGSPCRNGMFSFRMETSPVAVTYSAVTNGSQSRSSENRVRTPRPEVDSTSAVHRLPRIDAGRISGSGRGRDPGGHAARPAHPGVGHGSQKLRWVDTVPCDPTGGRRASDRAASG